MTKTLYVNGCSFTAGDEMIDPDGLDDIAYRKEHTWSGILSKMLGCNILVNDSHGGGSNNRIFRKTFNYVSHYIKENNTEDLFIVIGLTEPSRTEVAYTESDKCIARWQRIQLNMKAEHSRDLELNYDDNCYYHQPSLNKTDTDYINKSLKQFVSSKVCLGVDEYTEFIQIIVSLQCLFERYNIKYYMFSTFPVFLTDQSIPNIEHRTDKLINTTFVKTDICFIHFIEKHNYKVYHYGHPKEDAHNDWAQVLYKNIKENKLL